MQDSTLEAYALASGQKKSYDEMTQAEKVALRYAYVMDATKNSQGDFARTSGGTANQMRIFSESVKELGASFGQYILPVITPLLTKINNMVQAFGKLDEKTKKIILVVAGITAAIGPVILIIGSLAGAVGTIATTFAAASAAIAGVGGLTAVLGAIVAPVAIAIASVVGLIAIFTALYRNNETFRNKVILIWGNIQSTISSVIESIKSIITVFVGLANQIWVAHGEKIKLILTSLLNIIVTLINMTLNTIVQIFKAFSALAQGDWKGFFDSIKNMITIFLNGISMIFKTWITLIQNLFSSLKNAVVDVFSGLLNGIKSKVSEIISTIKGGIQSALDWIITIPEQMYSYGVNIVQGLIDGIQSMIERVKDAISSVARTVTSGVSDALDINSPSKVMIEMGHFVTDGLAIGIEDKKESVLKSINRVSSLINSTKDFVSASKSNSQSNNSKKDIVREVSNDHSTKLTIQNMTVYTEDATDFIGQMRNLVAITGNMPI